MTPSLGNFIASLFAGAVIALAIGGDNGYGSRPEPQPEGERRLLLLVMGQVLGCQNLHRDR